MQLLHCNIGRSSEICFFVVVVVVVSNLILPGYWSKNALGYKLFFQTSLVTFVKCLLLSPLKGKTMKYYLICNPRKCPKTTCPSLESCQIKKQEGASLRTRIGVCSMWLRSKVELNAGFQSPWENFHLFFLTHTGILGFEIDISNSLIVATQH